MQHTSRREKVHLKRENKEDGKRLGGTEGSRRRWTRRETWGREGAGPLAGLSGGVRMMNGRAARAVGALMGAAELYDTLLSVCERLLKAFKSADATAARLHQVRVVFMARRTKAKRVQPQSSIITLRQRSGTRQHWKLRPGWRTTPV